MRFPGSIFAGICQDILTEPNFHFSNFSLFSVYHRRCSLSSFFCSYVFIFLLAFAPIKSLFSLSLVTPVVLVRLGSGPTSCVQLADLTPKLSWLQTLAGYSMSHKATVPSSPLSSYFFILSIDYLFFTCGVISTNYTKINFNNRILFHLLQMLVSILHKSRKTELI